MIDRGPIDWIVSNRSIETNNALPDERFAIVGRNLALILKGSQMVAGGLTAKGVKGTHLLVVYLPAIKIVFSYERQAAPRELSHAANA